MKPRWTTILLAASLALNLFLVGAAVGVVALGARIAHERPGARPGLMLRRAARALPPQERRQFAATLRQAGRAVRPTALQAAEVRRQVWVAMSAPAFDAAAAKTRLKAARDLDQKARAEVEDAVIDFAARLPSKDRARLGAAVAGALPPPAPKLPPRP